MGWCRLSPLLGMMVMLAGLWPAAGQETGKETGPGEKAPPEELPFKVDFVIHPLVAKLPPPDFYGKLVAEQMAISSKSALAQKHVLQGMALIHAGWDFEAYRHFCEAVKVDPDCVMAYWGIGLSLAAPNNEFTAQRMVAVDRMLDLVDALGDKLPRMEQEYAMCLALLFSGGPGEAIAAFRNLAKNYPKNLQAGLLATYLQRDGYTEFGDPLYGQEQAIARMRQYREAYPDNLSVLSFWAMLHAEAPDAKDGLRKEVLPYVRKIVRLSPEFPPYQHLLGHFEWRCGNHRLAQMAFERASSLYSNYMKKHGLDYHSCEGWVRSRIYLATAFYSRGKFDEAVEIADTLRILRVEEDRLGSAGANMLLWEGNTLAARLYLARGQPGDMAKAIATFPGKDDKRLFKDRTLSIFYLEGLRQYLGGRQAIEEGNIEDAGHFLDAFEATLTRFRSLQGTARLSSSISEYVRAVTTLDVHVVEYRGLLALAGEAGGRRSAFNWFKAAVDRQIRPSRMLPPSIVYPLERRLGEYHMATHEYLKAAESYKAALVRRQNDLDCLLGYQQAFLKMERRLDAATIQKQIDAVRGE